MELIDCAICKYMGVEEVEVATNYFIITSIQSVKHK